MFLAISSQIKQYSSKGIVFVLILGLLTLTVFYYMGAMVASDVLNKTKDDIQDEKLCIKVKNETQLNYLKLFIYLVWIMLILRILFVVFTNKYVDKRL
jgi:uncharacterized membrane protein SpoIIM required for sporulation